MNDDKFNRVVRLVGNEAMKRIADCKVIIFGIGGVGSWTTEALVRTGIGHITIVDADKVVESNINRQSMATTLSVGIPKVEVQRKRILEINPQSDIVAINTLYCETTANDFDLNNYDYVIDAIDSLKDKALLILQATESKSKLYSSMGAALKMNPTRVSVTEFWKVKGCPLAAALRHKFKKNGVMPHKKFQCVYSDELLPNKGNKEDVSGAMNFGKARINGAMCHITGIFGFTLAGLLIEDLVRRS